MPAPTKSGFTTESCTLFIVGTREGDVRFGSLNDFVHDKKQVVVVRQNYFNNNTRGVCSRHSFYSLQLNGWKRIFDPISSCR